MFQENTHMLIRVSLILTLVVALGVGVLPASAAQTNESAPVLDVANPNAGDTLLTGKTIIQGVAYDPIASTGIGVDRVAFFLDASREDGGEILGEATLGTTNPLAASETQFADAGFTFTLPVVHSGNHQLYVYGHSEVTGMERVVAIPFVVGTADSPDIEGLTPAMSTWVLP
jgi:hypothetical protein